jgi:hypothetical protein
MMAAGPPFSGGKIVNGVKGVETGNASDRETLYLLLTSMRGVDDDPVFTKPQER